MEQKHLGGTKKRKTNINETKDHSHLAPLLDLQDFFSDELIDQGTAYRRAFTPLTEGLGLESPRQIKPKIILEEIEIPVETPKVEIPALEENIQQKPLVELNTDKPFKIQVTSLRNSPTISKVDLRGNDNRLAEVMDFPTTSPQADFFDSKIEPPSFELEPPSANHPPPLPRPSMFKRLLAGIIDQVFVLLIWSVMIVITSNLFNNFSTGFSIEIIADFSHPKFQRIAILEFAAAWLGYLGFSLLIFKRSFGMWVWSLGVSYGDKLEENYTLRKAMRIFWTFLFSAPIVPSIFLAIRKNGRNILDVLSGTNIYDAD